MIDPTLTGIAPVTPANPSADAQTATRAANTAASASQPTFAEMLRAQQGITAPSAATYDPAASGLRFSAHAQTRLQSRHITLDSTHMQRLQGAVQRAAVKGSRDALVLMDNMAMVVSVKNRTVVTVVDSENMKDNVFTNIDSAVIA